MWPFNLFRRRYRYEVRVFVPSQVIPFSLEDLVGVPTLRLIDMNGEIFNQPLIRFDKRLHQNKSYERYKQSLNVKKEVCAAVNWEAPPIK